VTSTVLAYIPSPPQGVWHLGPIPIRAYALCIIAGIVIAVYWGEKRFVARGGQPGTVMDVAVFAVPFGLVGGRLYHVATDWSTYFGPGGDPLRALMVWEGGLGIWGAVALGAVGAWIGCRRRGVPLPFFADAVAPAIVVAQAVGRLGNYFNQELYGRETTLPWGLQIFYRRDPTGFVDPHSLDGVSTGFNDNALARRVVAHGAPYVTPTKAGRSEGCPAMEPARAAELLPKLAEGGMVFLFAPNQQWMAGDPWLVASADAI